VRLGRKAEETAILERGTSFSPSFSFAHRLQASTSPLSGANLACCFVRVGMEQR
jgi:hypothetical protein